MTCPLIGLTNDRGSGCWPAYVTQERLQKATNTLVGVTPSWFGADIVKVEPQQPEKVKSVLAAVLSPEPATVPHLASYSLPVRLE